MVIPAALTMHVEHTEGCGEDVGSAPPAAAAPLEAGLERQCYRVDSITVGDLCHKFANRSPWCTVLLQPAPFITVHSKVHWSELGMLHWCTGYCGGGPGRYNGGGRAGLGGDGSRSKGGVAWPQYSTG